MKNYEILCLDMLKQLNEEKEYYTNRVDYISSLIDSGNDHVLHNPDEVMVDFYKDMLIRDTEKLEIVKKKLHDIEIQISLVNELLLYL